MEIIADKVALFKFENVDKLFELVKKLQLEILPYNNVMGKKILKTDKLDDCGENIKKLVQKWINLSGWDPDFETYWETAYPRLPDELRNFISEQIGINVVNQFDPYNIKSVEKLGRHRLVT